MKQTLHDMKQKISFAFCALTLVAGFFGLQAVSESSLPFWEGVGCIAGIILLMIPAVRKVNRSL